MQYVQLGSRGPKVSTVGFGTWAIGGMDWGKTDDDESRRALHAALDAGVTLLDTADVYGRGHSERLIAEVLAGRSREGIVVATKAGNDFYNADSTDDKGYGPIRQTYDKDYLIFAAEQSLKRLGVETLDILQLHSGGLDQLERDDPWAALEALKKQGKIRHAGWSVQSFQESAQAHILKQHHEVIDVLQVRYNLLERDAEQQLFPLAEQYGTGIIVRIPLLFGLLTGKFDRTAQFGKDDHRRMNLAPEKLAGYLEAMERLAPLYARYPQQTAAQVSLRFTVSRVGCHTVIPGGKTPAQVQDNAAASDFGPLTDDDLALVDRIFQAD